MAFGVVDRLRAALAASGSGSSINTKFVAAVPYASLYATIVNSDTNRWSVAAGIVTFLSLIFNSEFPGGLLVIDDLDDPLQGGHSK